MDSMKMMDDEMSMPKMPTCQMLPPQIMVSSDTPGVQCQRVSEGAIGNEHVLMMMPLDAVDVWGPSNVVAEVCFEGAGSITFLDAMYSPRKQMSLEYGMKDGMTCTSISGPGTVVLLSSMMMDDMMTMDKMDKMDGMDKMDDMMTMDDMDKMDGMDKMDAMKMDYAMMKDSMESMIPLTDCEVTARYNLNVRDEPGGEKIGLVAGGATKTPIARTVNWFKVEHDEAEGWISSHFIHVYGDCG
ncbi:MAG: SH3 domain-containing protein [Chloroflexi bacterium]|nr:SH3 domain-containing protein [Chloroflexota bacterium]